MSVLVLLPCCYCGKSALQSPYEIHRDGFGEGPEVPLCEACVEDESITCEMIWERIALRGETDGYQGT